MRLFAGTKYDQPPRCDRCGALEAECACVRPAAGEIVRLAVEKRKKGKVVTVIRGLTGGHEELGALLSTLQSRCGAGGTLQETSIEIQGDHQERIGEVLRELGVKIKH